MRTLLIAAIAVVALAAAASADDRYVAHYTPGTFSIDTFSFVPINSDGWEDGTLVRVSMTGVSSKKITAGTLKFQLYESFVTKKEAEGNLPYFKCNNKGCNTAEGETLFLSSPNSDRSDYRLEFDYRMGQAQKTGVFSLLIWGTDQFHQPYDFSVSVDYNYSFVQSAAPTVDADTAANLKDIVDGAPTTPYTQEPDTGILLPFAYNVTNGNMTVSNVYAYSNTNKWEAGAIVSIKMEGEIPSKHILAGTLKFKIYELGVRYFIDAGNFPYFKCDNKGCDPSDGIALHLNDPTSVPTAFTMTAQITIPKSIAGGRNPFNLLMYGVDQDHNPVDFSVSINYNLADLDATPAPAPALRGAVAPTPLPLPTPATPEAGILLPFAYNVTNGNMTVSNVYAYSNTNKWEAGAIVSIKMEGEIPSKHILAGTLKFKIYELGVRYFIDAGNFPYFKCDNKGCDPSDGIALHLNDPTSVPTAFTMTAQITIPKSIAGGRNPFNLLMYGVDQDHNPVDFSVSINYNLADL